MENNPYQTPQSQLVDTDNTIGIGLASRWQRLGAALIDMVIGIVASVPLWSIIGFDKMMAASQSFAFGIIAIGLVYGLLVTLLIHGYLLHKNGQTVGKKLVGIRIADMDAQVPALSKIFLQRILPVTLVAFIPLIGGLLSLVDVLFIFRKDKRCVHDFIAGTQVLKA